MTKPDEYVVVLWGKGFYEASATIFVTELRRVGLRVKVVGLTQRHSSGAFGLALVPDVTLDQILPTAGNAICLVIPYTSSGNNKLSSDPRLSKLFEQVSANNGKFIIGQLDKADQDLFPPAANKTVIDLSDENLIKVACELAHSLTPTTGVGSE